MAVHPSNDPFGGESFIDSIKRNHREEAEKRDQAELEEIRKTKSLEERIRRLEEEVMQLNRYVYGHSHEEPRF